MSKANARQGRSRKTGLHLETLEDRRLLSATMLSGILPGEFDSIGLVDEAVREDPGIEVISKDEDVVVTDAEYQTLETDTFLEAEGGLGGEEFLYEDPSIMWTCTMAPGDGEPIPDWGEGGEVLVDPVGENVDDLGSPFIFYCGTPDPEMVKRTLDNEEGTFPELTDGEVVDPIYYTLSTTDDVGFEEGGDPVIYTLFGSEGETSEEMVDPKVVTLFPLAPGAEPSDDLVDPMLQTFFPTTVDSTDDIVTMYDTQDTPVDEVAPTDDVVTTLEFLETPTDEVVTTFEAPSTMDDTPLAYENHIAESTPVVATPEVTPPVAPAVEEEATPLMARVEVEPTQTGTDDQTPVASPTSLTTPVEQTSGTTGFAPAQGTGTKVESSTPSDTGSPEPGESPYSLVVTIDQTF